MPANYKSSKVQPPFKDVYKVMEISKVVRRCSPSHTALSKRHSEGEKPFVRQKFRNAKCLYTDKKLQKSKEFVVSLGVLDSNKELLLKCLNQPDSMFAKHLHDMQGAHEFHYGHIQSMNSSALKHNVNVGGCQSGKTDLGKIDISFSHKHQEGFQGHSGRGYMSDSHTPSHVLAEGKKDACPIPRRIIILKPNIVGGAKAISLCGDPNIQIQLERLDSMASDPEGRILEESFEASGLKQCFKMKGFTTQELVALSGTHTLGNKGFENPTVFDHFYFKILLKKSWLSSAVMSSMIRLPSDRALVEDDDIHLICGIAMSSLTTSSSPSPQARISLLKILAWEVIKLLLLKDFTCARKSSGRRPYIECVLLDKLPLTMGLSSLIVLLEIVCEEYGGRVDLAKVSYKAISTSVRKHFKDNGVIASMEIYNDFMFLRTEAISLGRVRNDF
ncbi:hypothetical protein Nepgr_018519 [Nepenthes gracilis]|uniref:Plant heme peroxidase family profile domain-containing protein n=1 Tax=Nepenthes gracilis TaxID=150966 RepID=A0AAD3XTH1_NEPGR|nr:hypothetical protein Nepgr_018519 [Nepenthes gracilis]